MFDEVWENFRAGVYEYVKNRDEAIINKWLNEIGYTEPIGYHMNSWKNTLEIYTTKPGIMIGRAGRNTAKLRKMLAEEFRGKWKVKIIEIRGGFLNI